MKRSYSTGFADRSSSDKFVSSTPVSLDRKVQVQKQRNLPELASDSSSCSSDSTYEDSFTFELGWRPSSRAVGTPMKKLLAQEMSTETESKRRSPSVIARLMGLDGLPPQQQVNKPQSKCLKNHQERTMLTAKAHQSSTFHGRRSFRKSSRDEEEFKDVFEVLDAAKVESSSYPCQGTGYSNLTEADIAFIQQKFAYAKCFSTDEKLQQSKVLDDALEVQDSNNELFMKFLQQPDALFTKHLHDLQGVMPQSQSGYRSALKSSHSSRYESNGLGQKYERENLGSQKHQDGHVGHPYSRHVANNLPQSSKIQFEEQNEPAAFPTRIVVLKPNFGKAQNPTKPVSSPCSSHDFPADFRLPGVRNQEAELRGKKKFPEVVGLTRQNSKEPREIAKEVTRKMRSSIRNGSLNLPASGFRGYAGDESSCDISGSESAYESDVTTISSRAPFNWNSQYQCSSSRSTESYVSREAKKRLSERWKLTHRSQEMEVVSRSSTLGEMLAIPDREIRPEKLDGMMDRMGFNGKVFNNSGPRGWVDEPLGISSRDGWKDGFVRNLSRSRSLPASSSLLGSPKASTYHENVCDDRFKIPKEVMKRERTKSVKGTPNHKEFLGRSSRSTVKRSAHCSSRLYGDSSTKIDFSQRKCKSKYGEGVPSEPDRSTSETHSTISIDPLSVNENGTDAGHKKITVPSELSDLDLSTSSLLEGNLPTGDLEVLRSQKSSSGDSKGDCRSSTGDSFPHPVGELQPSASAKEPDQPSPVSVLEAPFPDDLSSGSECFESISADLHGLRVQLQLLKLESEAYEEGPMLISSDEDGVEEPIELADEKMIPKAEENWESLYFADFLTDSGLKDADADTFMARCHSPECPVSLSVFEGLEKKYCKLQSWSRSERRLLFDCINKKLLEIFEHLTDPHPWVRPARRVVPTKDNKNGLVETLQELLICQDKEAGTDAGEMTLSRDSQWLDMRVDIDIIGREIERLLTDELVAEAIVM